MRRRKFLQLSAAAAACQFSTEVAAAVTPQPRRALNDYIIKAVSEISSSRAGGGYGLSYAYTKDLDYGAPGAIPQTPPQSSRSSLFRHATMCVAGTAEVIIEAINLYAADQSTQGAAAGPSPYPLLPASMWSSGSLTSLRPYLWLQEDTRDVFRYRPGEVPRGRRDGAIYNALSRGTAHSLHIFNMGEELPFSELRRGDFINLNRASGTGHAVIFWSYIGKDNRHSPQYTPDALGFEYFSAQGPKQGGGFDFRDAYFGPAAHTGTTAGRTADPGIILRQRNQVFLNSGRLWHPAEWRIADAVDAIRARVYARTSGPAGSRDAAANALLQEDQGPSVVSFTTGDDS